jgi:flagellar basal-body rod protein FlgF
MDRMLYIAMTGAAHTMRAQTVNSNNLANANTTGFRADLAAFSTQELQGPGHDSRAYGTATRGSVDFNEGPIIQTGRELDVAIQGEGWIAVQGADGSEAYTRAGDLKIDPNGLLVTGAGYPVLGNSGAPIAIPPAEKMEIGVDGTISIRPVGQGAETLAVVDRIRLVNPELNNMQKGEDGLFRTRDQQPAIPDAGVRVASGAIEGSNVSAVEGLVRMIELSRQFEMQVKMMKTAEDNDRASAQIMSIS